MMPATALRATGLGLSLGGKPVIHDLTLDLKKGEWICVVGPNGAGKSTLLRGLAGLLPADRGELTLMDRPLSAWPPRTRSKCLAWLGQGETPSEDWLVRDLVRLGRLPHGHAMGWSLDPGADDAAVDRALETCQVQTLADRRIADLSSGERQRVLLARALAVEASVMLLDEPGSHLDPPHVGLVGKTLRDLALQGRSVLSVVHDLNFALWADRIAVMQDGRLAAFGRGDEAPVRAAIESVFEHSVQIRWLDDRWVSLLI